MFEFCVSEFWVLSFVGVWVCEFCGFEFWVLGFGILWF